MHLMIATTAGGVSKQNSHPFKVMQKRQSCGFLYGLVYLSYASYAYQSYWLCDRCDKAFMLKKHQLPSMTSKCCQMGKLMIYWCFSSQENKRNHTLRM